MFEHFTGTLVTDCSAGYETHVAGARQKCQAHLARTARDWQKLTIADSADFRFFEAIREFVRRGCEFHRLRKSCELTQAQQKTQKLWLRECFQQLIVFPVTHEKAVTLQRRILKHQHEWLCASRRFAAAQFPGHVRTTTTAAGRKFASSRSRSPCIEIHETGDKLKARD
ncbi:MAG: hypothetical protein R3C17_20270 [Planctomycetaceae bacterium]